MDMFNYRSARRSLDESLVQFTIKNHKSDVSSGYVLTSTKTSDRADVIATVANYDIYASSLSNQEEILSKFGDLQLHEKITNSKANGEHHLGDFEAFKCGKCNRIVLLNSHMWAVMIVQLIMIVV